MRGAAEYSDLVFDTKTKGSTYGSRSQGNSTFWIAIVITRSLARLQKWSEQRNHEAGFKYVERFLNHSLDRKLKTIK
jgi:hypothetical protein